MSGSVIRSGIIGSSHGHHARHHIQGAQVFRQGIVVCLGCAPFDRIGILPSPNIRLAARGGHGDRLADRQAGNRRFRIRQRRSVISFGSRTGCHRQLGRFDGQPARVLFGLVQAFQLRVVPVYTELVLRRPRVRQPDVMGNADTVLCVVRPVDASPVDRSAVQRGAVVGLFTVIRPDSDDGSVDRQRALRLLYVAEAGSNILAGGIGNFIGSDGIGAGTDGPALLPSDFRGKGEAFRQAFDRIIAVFHNAVRRLVAHIAVAGSDGDQRIIRLDFQSTQTVGQCIVSCFRSVPLDSIAVISRTDSCDRSVGGHRRCFPAHQTGDGCFRIRQRSAVILLGTRAGGDCGRSRLHSHGTLGCDDAGKILGHISAIFENLIRIHRAFACAGVRLAAGNNCRDGKAGRQAFRYDPVRRQRRAVVHLFSGRSRQDHCAVVGSHLQLAKLFSDGVIALLCRAPGNRIRVIALTDCRLTARSRDRDLVFVRFGQAGDGHFGIRQRHTVICLGSAAGGHFQFSGRDLQGFAGITDIIVR